LTLEQAINKAQDVLAKAGHPPMFLMLRATHKGPAGGWELEYENTLVKRVVTVEFDASGDVTAITSQDRT
jgi:hypothetical protein